MSTPCASAASISLSAADRTGFTRSPELDRHALDADHEGPRLRGVFGRPAGKVATFRYSEALQRAKVTWDEAELNKWLTDTESVAPDNDMGFRVPKQEERAAIISYLKSLSNP